MNYLLTIFLLISIKVIYAQSGEDFRNKASEARARGEYEIAIGFINKAIERDSTFVENYLSKGFYLEMLKKYQEAYDNFSHAILTDLNYGNSYDYRANLLSRIGQYEPALEDHAMSIKLAENDQFKAQYLNSRAITKGFLKDTIGSYNDLLLAVQLKPNYVAALNTIGTTCMDMGKDEEALSYLSRASKADPTNFRVCINIGFIYQKMDSNMTAIKYFDQAMSLNPNAPEMYSNRSLSRMRIGKISEALADINRSLELWPENPYAYWVRALIYIEQKQLELALQDLNSAEKYGYNDFYGTEVANLKRELSKDICNCKEIDQGNGTTYVSCAPFLQSDNSIGLVKLGISGLGQDRFIHVNLGFDTEPQAINSMLTFTFTDSSTISCVLVKRDLSEIDGVETAYGLFVVSSLELNSLGTKKIISIEFRLIDNALRTFEVTYLSTDLESQIECIEK